jgi:hypothetical protein
MMIMILIINNQILVLICDQVVSNQVFKPNSVQMHGCDWIMRNLVTSQLHNIQSNAIELHLIKRKPIKNHLPLLLIHKCNDVTLHGVLPFGPI